MTEDVEEQMMGKLNYWHRWSSISKAVLLRIKESLMANGLMKNCRAHEWVSAF